MQRRAYVPGWIRKGAATLLIAMIGGLASSASTVVQWYGDGRSETTLNQATRQQVVAIEDQQRRQDEVLRAVEIAVAKLSSSVDTFNATVARFASRQRAEDDRQWKAIDDLRSER